ncbi:MULTISPECIES: aldehyde dehydrogenase family protein [Nocardiaceae]|uniref:aldehyde dehydrogenase family protein n=1 Tax=Nocardiaceae TaxID=85025 RepID=UPI00050CD0A2|nr:MULTISPECIES: aldehyde dehydrogenase family protein [Rhodococcus]KJV03556.1 putative aldehyde dehydrogenase [Rhodococcus sp. PML026]
MTTIEQSTSADRTSADVNSEAGRNAEQRLMIDGVLRASRSGDTFDNISPATGAVIGVAAAAGREDMDEAIGAARRAFDETEWSTDRTLRRRVLLQLHEALVSEQEQLRTEIIAEAGSPLSATYLAQLDWPLADGLTYPAELIDTYEWERDLGPLSFGPADNKRRVYKEPIGVVGAIAPWNFPFEIIVNKIGQALATGNTMILKPDPNTPWTSTRIGRLMAEHTDIPAGVFNVVPTPNNSIAEMLVSDPRVDMVSFTGSTGVGKMLQQKASASLKRVFLELGGKSAMIALEDADLAQVIPSAAQACLHAGQGCALTTRLLVPNSRYDEVVEMVTDLYGQLPVGDPADLQTFVGPVINVKQKARILGMLQGAAAEGGRITVGGGAAKNLPEHLAGGFYIEPTVIAGTTNDATIAQQEVFGPVLTVLGYDTEDQAVRIANDSMYGLSGAIFSASTEHGLAVAKRIRTGSMSVNGGVFYGADSPYGGYKVSGQGRQNGLEGFEQHLETKAIGFI